MTELFWRLLPSVRRPERPRFLFFMNLSGLIMLALTLGLVGAESLLLAAMGAGVLPLTFIAASALTVFGSLIYALGVDQSRNDVYFIRILGVLALLVGLTTVGAAFGLRWTLPLLFCLYYLSLAVLNNHYWTFTGDYFDTLAAKRLFPLFTVGASAGGLIGGLLATALAQTDGGAYVLLGAWSVTLLLAALLLRVSRRQLRRWGPLELEEADETSIQGMKASVRYLRQSDLGRWLVVSALGMVLALFVSQYLYSDIFAREFPSAERLALFLGAFLAFTNLLEIVIEVAITPRLVQRLGVASANLVHPLLTLVAFLLLSLDYAMAAACAARVNRETIENALAGPVRNLVYNALPARFRGRMRAFLEGIVVYSGMVTAGIALLVLQNTLSPFWLCVAGGVTALLYLGANLKVRSEYLKTLVSELRAGRLDLAELSDVGYLDVSRLTALWEGLLAANDVRAVVGLVDPLAARGIYEPILAATREDKDPRVRRACLAAVGRYLPRDQAVPVLLKALHDAEPQVRLAALKGLPREDGLRKTLEQLLEDPDPNVRAEAALRTGLRGAETLREMCRSQDTGTAVAALHLLPSTMLELALKRCGDRDFAIRAAALECCARESAAGVDLDDLIHNLSCDHIRVRLATLRLLACRPDDLAARSALAAKLGDPSWEVRQLAAELLAALGDRGVRAAAPYLEIDNVRAVTAAIHALGRANTPLARELLAAELRNRVWTAWEHLLAIHLIPENGNLSHRFLKLSLDNAVTRNRRLAFQILEEAEDSTVIRSVEKVLRFANARVRADALEVLSNLGDREASSLLVLMLEDTPLGDKVPIVQAQIAGPDSLEQVLTVSERSVDRWIRMACAGAARAPGEGSAREEMMERLLVLRRVPLFAQMTLEQLDAINQLLHEEQYLQSETIFREGDVGDELYILVEGEVQVFKSQGSDELVLSTMTDGSYFGEMAILDDEPRSASVRATRDARLLVLKGEQLKELIFQMPEIAFEIFKVLTSRIRKADRRLDEASRALATADHGKSD